MLKDAHHLAFTVQPLLPSSCLTVQPHQLPLCPYFRRKLCAFDSLFVFKYTSIFTPVGGAISHAPSCCLLVELNSHSQRLGSDGQWQMFLPLGFHRDWNSPIFTLYCTRLPSSWPRETLSCWGAGPVCSCVCLSVQCCAWPCSHV